MDTLTPDERSRIMSLVRGKDTRPEMLVRQLVHRLGYRFRLHRRDLPGSPDLVFTSRQAVIFVHGCFWHRHTCLNGQRLPKSQTEWWRQKLEGNRRRDQRVQRQLRRQGWRVMIVWECQLKKPEQLVKRVRRFLG